MPQDDEDALLCIELYISDYKIELMKNFTTGIARVQDVHSMLVNSIQRVQHAIHKPSLIEEAFTQCSEHWSVVCQVLVVLKTP